MNDVFDEDLIKELGLDPSDFKNPGAEGAPAPKKKPVTKPVAKPAAKAEGVPPKPAAKPVAAKPKAEPAPAPAPAPKVDTAPDDLSDHGKNLTQNIPVQLVAVLAKKAMKLKDVIQMKTGEVLEFRKMPEEPIDLVANGKLVAKADLVLVDGKVGARIVKLVK
jgi:flagellar motor switch protein FliN